LCKFSTSQPNNPHKPWPNLIKVLGAYLSA
jgi:hypothetical protein